MKENIEEDIKVAEKLLLHSESILLDEESMAIEHILSDYKRVLKKNEDWEKAYQEEKDKQFELLRANQKLQEVNEELKVERDGIYEDYQDLGKEKWSADEAILFLTERLENSIPKQKIKDKIEEYLDYDKEHKTYTKDGRENFTIEYFKAKALQELLEEKDKQIDLILDKFIEGTEYYYSEFDYMNKEEVKQYFENKAKEK